MFGYIQFAEDYFSIITSICRGLKEKVPDIEFGGVALRRKTVCSKVDSVAEELNINSYEWLNDIETRILALEYDEQLMCHYRDYLGSDKLRFIIDADRDISPGYVSGAKVCRTAIGEILRNNDERLWKYVIGLVDYFYKSFSSKRPDFIFMNEITFGWEIAIFIVAEKLGIPCLSLAYMRSCQGYCITDDVYGLVPRADQLYQRSLEDSSLVKMFLPAAKKIVEDCRNQEAVQDCTVFARKRFRKQCSVKAMISRFITDIAIIIAIRFKLYGTGGVVRQLNGYDWLRAGLKVFCVSRKALRGKPFEPSDKYIDGDYIFYPLHYEPESSTSVASHKMTNQLALIENLSKNMPFGYRLLVKEHIPSIGLRPDGFYERIKNLPDVHLVSPFEDTLQLIKKSKLVVVLTGSVAWEAIILGIPAIVFGNAEFTGIQSGFKICDNTINIADDILEAMQMPGASDKELTHFIASQIAFKTDFEYVDYTAKFDNRKHDESRSVIYRKQLAQQILGFVEEYRRKNMEGDK